jgi:hypothetical protein
LPVADGFILNVVSYLAYGIAFTFTALQHRKGEANTKINPHVPIKLRISA